MACCSHKKRFASVWFENVGLCGYWSTDVNVSVPFIQELTVCLCKVGHCQRFSFRNVQFFGEYPCESVDEEGLSACLFVDGFNDFWSEGLLGLVCILPKEFLHLSQRKIK